MVLPVFKAMKRFAEAEIANDIESHKLEPVAYVDLLRVIFCQFELVMESNDKKISVLLQKMFLFSQCLIRKGVRNYPPLPSMIFVISPGHSFLPNSTN